MNENPNYPTHDPRTGIGAPGEVPGYGEPAVQPGPGGPTAAGAGPFASGTGPSGAGAGAGAGAGPADTGAPYTTNAPYGQGAPGGPGYGYAPIPPPAGVHNPALACVLGFIPGVGAMYNGQFAKGLAHIVIFAVLISLANNISGLFGLLIAGWLAYMVFDAYQTARARRDGLVAPDPFGLNNIGERLGLGHGPNWNDFVARPAPGTPSAGPQAPGGNANYSAAPFTETPPQYGSPLHNSQGPNFRYEADRAATGYQSADFRYETSAAGTFYQDPNVSYVTGAYANPAANPAYTAGGPGYGAMPNPFSGPYAGAYAPPIPGAIPPPDPAAATRSSGLPTGAIVLIGLGVLALISTLGHEYFWPSRFIGGLALMLVGGALVFRRLQEAQRLYPSNTAAASWFSIRNSKGGVFVAAVGILFLLSASHWHAWFNGWPYLLILLGLYQIAERAAYNRMAAETASATAAATAYPAPAAAATAGDPGPATQPTRGTGSLSITPRRDSINNDEEGR